MTVVGHRVAALRDLRLGVFATARREDRGGEQPAAPEHEQPTSVDRTITGGEAHHCLSPRTHRLALCLLGLAQLAAQLVSIHAELGRHQGAGTGNSAGVNAPTTDSNGGIHSATGRLAACPITVACCASTDRIAPARLAARGSS